MAHYGTSMVHFMAYKAFEIDEDDRKYREFLASQQFRNASRALSEYETDAGGLTPAEVWQEVNLILADLRTIDAADREDMVVQLFNREKRRLRTIERDGEVMRLEGDGMNRTLTSIFYCLALRLERTSKVQAENPHNYLIDAIVRKLADIHHPVLALLHYVINKDGDAYEARHHKEISPLDPLAEDGEWLPMLNKVLDHYSNRMWTFVKRDRQTDYNRFWEQLISNRSFVALVQEDGSVKGDESLEFEVKYNAKALFNIFGMMFDRGYFERIGGKKPLAEKVSQHYDKMTHDIVCAKAEYFKAEDVKILPQYVGLPADMMAEIARLLD